MVMDLNDVKIVNPWWQDPSAIDLDPYLQEILGKPYYFNNPIKEALDFKKGHTYILRGARQVGKTTLIKEMIRRAIQGEGIAAKNCLFLSCEAFKDYSDLQHILADWLSDRRDVPTRIFLDEITFVDQWQRALLWMINAGLLKNTTTVISGSNARDLKRMGERFPGRHVKEISIYPLSVGEYRDLKCFKSKDGRTLLKIYMSVGGFPHAIRDYHEFGTISDETYETYANWVFGDAYRFELTRELLTHILFRVYDTLASQVTYQRLIEKSPVKSHETAAAYVEHLELAFLCKILHCYDQEKDMAAPRKARKIYFIDPLLYQLAGGFLRGIRNTHAWWMEQLSDSIQRGNLFESIVINQLARENDRIYYWYSSNLKKEVDVLIREGEDMKLFEIKSKKEGIKSILGHEVQVITPESFIEKL